MLEQGGRIMIRLEYVYSDESDVTGSFSLCSHVELGYIDEG
jgi:hypothetical protein